MILMTHAIVKDENNLNFLLEADAQIRKFQIL